MERIRRSLRLKISLGVGLALVVLLAPFNWLQYQTERSEAIADLSRLASTTGSVAEYSMEGAMLNNNRPQIQTIVDSLAQAPGVRTVYLLNTQAVVAASPGATLNGQQLDRGSAVCQNCHRYPAETRPHSVVVRDAAGQPVFRTMTPISNRPACVACHSPQDRLNGVLYVDFSMAGLNERLEAGLGRALLASAAIILLAAFAIYALLSRLVITPVQQVGRALRRFAGGERSARAAPAPGSVRSQDEVAMLATGFNDLAATIQAQETKAEGLYAELEAKDAVRRQLLGRLTAAREEERRYLARELHDELGQLLTGLSLHLKLGRQAIPDDPGAATDHLVRAGELIGETIDESHRLIADLRPTVLDDLGLVPALREELRGRLSPLGIRAELDASGDGAALSPEIATTAFRIAQEAITNVIRHAHARQVTVTVARSGGCLVMTVDDDGVGLPDGAARVSSPDAAPGDPLPGGPARVGGAPAATSSAALGILGMQERADALGGTLDVISREPCGTRVRLSLPLERPS